MGRSILISNQGGGVSQEDFDMAIDNLQMQIDNIPDYTTAGLVTEDDFINATNGLNIALEGKLDIEDYNDYTTAGLVTEDYVINEILGKQVEFESVSFYDRRNVSTALTLETFLDANESTCEFVRDNTWKTELLGVTTITSSAAAAAGIPPLFIRVFEYDATSGAQRGFGQGNLAREIQVDAPIPTSFYVGGHAEDNDSPILLTPDFRLFVDIQHSGGWDFNNLQVKLHLKHTKIA